MTESEYRLAGECFSLTPTLLIRTTENEIELDVGKQDLEVNKLVSKLISGASESEIEQIVRHSDTVSVGAVLKALKEHGLLHKHVRAKGRTGKEVLLEIEDLSNKLLYKTLYKNVFWKKCSHAQTLNDIPINVVYGLIIENYHFLHRESYFDAPVLSYVSNTAVRLVMNEFYAEEYGHDELILKSLETIGISRDDLSQTAPLPETMALCNALAYWAHNDPLFFYTTLGILEGKDIKQDSFLDAAYRIGVSTELLSPVKAHSDINLNGKHGTLTRKIFSQIPVINEKEFQRMKAQTHLFIELYDQFYSGIWKFYANTDTPLRKIEMPFERKTNWKQ
jgi:hypothetical protein